MDLAQQRGADVALLDVAVPHLEDGYAVAGQPRPDVPLLVAVTGFADGEHRRRCEEAGFDLVFVKPVDHDLVQALLADAAGLIADAGQSGGQPQVWDEQARQGWTALRARWRYQQELTAGPGGAGDG
jgi:DNA-binding response OmpR family regulator